MDFGKSDKLFMHLMLHGKLFLQTPGEQFPNYKIAALHFKDQVLYFTGYQKSAHLILNPLELAAVNDL